MNTTVFVSAFVIYIVFLIGLGWFVSRQQRGGEDFLLAGRSLPMMLTLATTLATMVGTGSSIGAVGYGYDNGWAGALYGIGGALGILLIAWWFAPVRQQRFMTMSEELSWYVGANRLVKNLVGVLILFACIGWLGAHILGGGMYLAWIAGVDPTLAKLLIAAGFSIYIVIGGYRAVVWTDAIQVVVLFFGFILMAVMSIHLAGGWEHLMSSQPRENLSFLGLGKVGLVHGLSLVVVIIVGVLATPSFRQRIYSASSVSAARRSFAWSGSLYLFFSFIPALIGMAAFAMNPELENRNFSFPFLAMEVLPLTIGVIVLIAGLSATMSSASSDAIAGVAILLRDIYILFTGRVPPERSMVLYSRIGLVAIIGVSMLLAMISDDIIVYITGMIATIMSGMCVCGVLGRFWRGYTWQGAIASLVGGSAISAWVMLSPAIMSWWGNPIIPALLGALGAGVLVSWLTPANSVSPEEASALLARERDLMEKQAG